MRQFKILSSARAVKGTLSFTGVLNITYSVYVHVCVCAQVCGCGCGCCTGGADGCIPLTMHVDVCQCCCLLMFVCLPLSRHFPCKIW